MFERPSIPLWLVAIDVAIRLVVAVQIVYRRREVSASLAWLAVLAFLPFLGAVLYFLIGENKLGSRRLRRFLQLSRGLDERASHLWRHRHVDADGELASGRVFWGQVARFGTAVSGLPPLKGNRLTLLPDAEEMLASLCRDIDEAQSHCHLLYYIWQRDGAEPVEAVERSLIRAARRGVECRVLVDAVGSKHFLRGRMVQEMRAAGVQVVAALPVNPVRMLFARIDLRNHRKIAVIDGRIGYCGSQNLTDSTFRAGIFRRAGPYIDSTVRIEGPGAGALGVIFLQDWQIESEQTFEDLERFVPDHRGGNGEGCVVQVIPSGPGPAPEAIHQALLTTIYSAREELIMTTPYFVPDEAMRKALQAAALRGVRVTLVMPCLSDSRIVAAASRSHYLDLLESGVKIMHFRGGLLHSKTVTVDRKIGLIGSTNFDARSFWLNFEATMFIYDDDFASVLRFMQTDYIGRSYEIHLDEWRRRPLWHVLRDNTAQLLGPLL